MTQQIFLAQEGQDLSSDVRDSLLRIMELKTNRILVTSFASNVARMSQFFLLCQKKQVGTYVWLADLCRGFIKLLENVVT